MEKGKAVQGRGFIVLNGQVFGHNIEPGKPLRMHKNLVAELASKGDILAQVESLVTRSNLDLENVSQAQKTKDELQTSQEMQANQTK